MLDHRRVSPYTDLIRRYPGVCTPGRRKEIWKWNVLSKNTMHSDQRTQDPPARVRTQATNPELGAPAALGYHASHFVA